jgi:hypothetical protein
LSPSPQKYGFGIRDPGTEIRDPGVKKAPDPGSQTHIFEGLVTIFWEKTSKIKKKGEKQV